MPEKPFRRYFAWAQKQPGLTGVSLLRFLETRLDNVVHRLGLDTADAHGTAPVETHCRASTR